MIPGAQLVEKVFSTSCLRFQNFLKVLKSVDLNGAGHPSWVHLRAKSRAAPGCAPKRPAGQPRTPLLPVFMLFRVYRQPEKGEALCLSLFYGPMGRSPPCREKDALTREPVPDQGVFMPLNLIQKLMKLFIRDHSMAFFRRLHRPAPMAVAKVAFSGMI